MRPFARVVMAVCLVGGLVSRAVRGDAPPAPAKPNILFLLADDMRWDTMGCVGNRIIRTPNLDALAVRGVLFPNHFVTSPICCVSRASIFSGQWERRHHIPDFATPFSDEAWAQTYPMRLKAGGYFTGFIGKFVVGDKMPESDLDSWHGFRGQGVYFAKGEREHLTAKMGDQALEFLSRGAGSGKPFCLSVSFKAPHAQDGAPREFPPDARDESLYADTTMPFPLTGTEAAFGLMPPFVQHSESRKRWERRFATPDMFQHTVRDYYRLVSGIDREVGRIMQTLARLHVTDNTVIVFTSDNGMFLGEHGLADKWLMYEESIRDPLIVIDPRLPASRQNVRANEMTLNVDFAPTLLDYAGLPVPPAMQGHSLRPLVEGQSVPWRDEAYFEHHTLPKIIAPSECVRTARWKYIRYVEPNPLVEELYDLSNDPHETHNLAAEPAQTAKMTEMRAKWRNLKEAAR